MVVGNTGLCSLPLNEYFEFNAMANISHMLSNVVGVKPFLAAAIAIITVVDIIALLSTAVITIVAIAV